MKKYLLLSTLFFALYTSAFSQNGAAPLAEEPKEHVTWKEGALLGIVEGLTEYLPVSSTGHLILTQRILGMGSSEHDKKAADAYAIIIQLGAILAVLGLYFNHMRRMLLGLFGKDPEGLKLLTNTLIAFSPAVVIGLIFVDTIKAILFGLWPIVIAWLVGGVIILIVEKRKGLFRNAVNDLYELPPQKALMIGFIQCLAMWPGTSRSLCTILGGRFAGLSLSSSITFSFILGVVTLGASTLYDTIKHVDLVIESFGAGSLIAGFLFAFASAIIAIKWMVGYLNRKSLSIFGGYRITLALVTAAALLFGFVEA